MVGRSICRLRFAAAIPYVLAIQVTPNSPCSSVCVDSTTLDLSDPNSSNTVASSIVCEDADYINTSDGKKWDQCMTCLQSSTFVQGGESDQYWFLYNLRYIFDHCVFGYANGTDPDLTPCATESACGPLKTGLEYGNLSTVGSEFRYCNTDVESVTGDYFEGCHSCVSSSGTTQYVANVLVALKAGCEQRPNVTSILGLDDVVFSSADVSIVDPASLVVDSTSASAQLSTAAIAGIVVGSVVLVLVIASCMLIRHHKRQKRAAIGIKPRWGSTPKTHKRKSSFSFRCRHILSSPISPKFFRDDLTTVEEDKQYGSLDQMASTQVSGVTGEEHSKRYFIDSKAKPQRYAYEAAWSPQHAPPSFQSFSAPQENMEEFGQQIAPGTSERRYFESEAKPQRFAYEPAWSPQHAPQSFQSFAVPSENVGEPKYQVVSSRPERAPVDSKPKSQRYAYEPVWSPQFAPSSSQSFATPPGNIEELGQQTPSRTPLSIITAPNPPEPARRSPKQDTFSVLKAIHNPLPPRRSTSSTQADIRSANSSLIQPPNGNPRLRLTTMSSQGSGLSNFRSPTVSSPLVKQKSGWPSPRDEPDGGILPPSPPDLTPSLKYGRKSSRGSMRKRRESGSPVESRQIQTAFPVPPQR